MPAEVYLLHRVTYGINFDETKSNCQDEDTPYWGVFESDTAVTSKPALVMPTPSHPPLPPTGTAKRPAPAPPRLCSLEKSGLKSRLSGLLRVKWNECFCWIRQKQGNLLSPLPFLCRAPIPQTRQYRCALHTRAKEQLNKIYFPLRLAQEGL